jgi:hypothetical protein
MERICALEGCSEVVPSNRKKYCSLAHQRDAARSSYQRRKVLGTLNLSMEEKIEAERERLKQQQLAKTLMELQRGEAKRQEYLSAIRETLEAWSPSEPIPVRELPGSVEVEWAIALSDWQVGQSTPLQSTGGVYEQTTALTRLQIDTLYKAIKDIHFVEVERGRKRVRRIWLNFLGDLVDGDCLRPAHAAQVDRVVMKQVIEVFDLCALFIRYILSLPGVEQVIADFVGGNHDRTSSRPGNASLGEVDYVDTYAWLIGSLLQRLFENDPRVEIKNWETFFGYRKFAGMRHVFEHGASFRTSGSSYGGVPWYPIVNAAKGLIQMLGGAEVVWFGHFHQPAILPLGQDGWIIMNGSLTASSQFIQSSFKAVRQPLQWLVEFHEEHGVTQFLPLYANVGQVAPAGSVWREGNQ